MRIILFLLRKTLIYILLVSTGFNLYAEGKDSLKHNLYDIYHWIDIPVTAGLTATAYWGWVIADSKPPLDSLTITGLDANTINRFDRPATRQEADFAPTARTISDITLIACNALPFLLLADKKIRQDWGSVLLLFLETQVIVANLYSWGSVVHQDRIRPLVYNPEVPWDERAGIRTQNSFYSGHTSMSASASFFAAKVYCDYHPELGNKKYIVYSLALLPPAATGFFRYKGMKHFPTDVLMGLAVGSATGILVPHIHKRTGPNLSIAPFTGRANGLVLTYKF